MSLIMVIGVSITIMLLFTGTYFYAKSLEQDSAKDDFEAMRNYFRALGQMVQKFKDASISTEDLEKEVDRDAAYASKLQNAYGVSSHRSGRLSWYICLVAFAVLMLAILLEAYINRSVQEAYQRGVIEAVQKADQAVKGALGDEGTR